MSIPAIAIASFAIALVATPILMVGARGLGIVDHPGELKPQSLPVPYLGGVAVFAGTAVGALDGRPWIILPLAAALTLGVADDWLDLPPVVRLVGEVGIGIMVSLSEPVRFQSVAASLLVVVVTVLLINGVNLLDGLDLLAGGVTAAAALAFALLLSGSGRDTAVALGSALVAFLIFNRPPARIYLGDGGAYVLGATLAVLLGASWGPHRGWSDGLAGLAVVALIGAEVAFAVIRRLRGRASLTKGDRGHPYDRLVARGWPPAKASLSYIGVEAVLALGAVAVAHHLGLRGIAVFDVAAAVVLVALAWSTGALAPDRGTGS